jgi:MFS superfamily sulfate permease-like transporter
VTRRPDCQQDVREPLRHERCAGHSRSDVALATLQGIVVAVIASLLGTEGRLFFANAERVADRIWSQVEQARPRVLLLDCRAIFDVEYTALKILGEAREKLLRSGCELWLAGLNPAVFEVVDRSQLGATLGRERMFLNMQAAVEEFQQRGEK